MDVAKAPGLISTFVPHQGMAKKKASKAPKATTPKTGLAEHPVLVGFTAKEHARIVRAAGKTELSARAFIHQAAITAVGEVL